MDAVNVMGWVAIVVGSIVLLQGAWTALGWLAFRAQWKWGDLHQMRRSVRLGWNTGMPPEGEWVLTREHANGVITGGPKIGRDHDWALMKRVGNRCYSASGGYSTPATNITGWLYVIEGEESP